MNESQSLKLSTGFQLLPDFVAAALRIMEPKPTNRSILEVDQHCHIAKSTPISETPVSLLLKRRDAVFAESPLRFRPGGRINIRAPCDRGSKSIMLSQPYMQQRSLTNNARIPLLTALEREEEILELTDAVCSLELSEKKKQAMVV